MTDKEKPIDHRPPNGFLKGIDIRYFMDCYEEWHALVQGWAEVICPWRPMHRILSEILANEIKSEHHYYMVGRALGVFTWIGIAKLIQAIF